MALNPRQEAFVLHFLRLGEAYAAALEAGYAKSTAKEACYWVNPEALKNPDEKKRKKFKPELYEAIKEKTKELETPLIADAEEVLRYFTSVMRGESKSWVLARTETGAEVPIEKPPDEKEKLKAAENLAKRLGLDSEEVEKLAKLDKLKAETARIKGESPDEENADDGFMEAMRGEVESVWQE